MADLVITATSVVAGAGASVETGFLGENCTAGQAVYKDPTLLTWFKADNNAAGKKVAGGILLNGGNTGQACVVLKSGPITIGATMTLGAAYYLSDTPGGVCPDADVGTGEDVCLLGFATTTAILNVNIQAPGVTRP